LDRALNPKTVAVVGDKKDSDYMWLKAMSTFQGKVYSVQIDPNEIPGIEEMGVTNLPSLLDIPEPVDYVVVAVPRPVAPRIVADCIKKEVGGATLFTSGFAETATEEGIQMQRQIAQAAKDAGLALIGPNCMGVFNPKVGLRFSRDQYSGEAGEVAFISQSGSHASSFATAAYASGVKVSKVVSYGNAVVLTDSDFLEYFADDPETKIIGMYIEGTGEGRRLFNLLKKITPKKPVFIWKGGQTEEGKRATSSHTGSLAESANVWEALLRQCGAIQVNNLEEAADVAAALTYLPPVTGNRVGLTGGAGGQSVSMTDAFSKAGLSVPALSEDSYSRLSSFFVLVGASHRNPIDMGSNRSNLKEILEILATDENIDAVAMQLSPRFWLRSSELVEEQMEALIELKTKLGKPVLAMMFSPSPQQDAEAISIIETRLQQAGIPSFPSYDRAAKSLKKVSDYYRFHQAQ
jgi:acyl-CoA synthetase (NDP forming)